MQSRLGDSGLLGFWETIQQLQAGESRVQNKSLSKVEFLGESTAWLFQRSSCLCIGNISLKPMTVLGGRAC